MKIKLQLKCTGMLWQQDKTIDVFFTRFSNDVNAIKLNFKDDDVQFEIGKTYYISFEAVE